LTAEKENNNSSNFKNKEVIFSNADSSFHNKEEFLTGKTKGV